MKTPKSLLLLSLGFVSLLLAVPAAKADPSFTFTLSQAYQSGTESVVGYDATVTNNAANTVYLNSDGNYVDSPLSLDDSPFLNNWPLTLGPGDSYTGLLFDVDVPPGTLGDYTGYFQILGDYTGLGGTDLLGTANFEFSATPEPSSFLLLGTGLFAMIAVRRRTLAGRTLLSVKF